MAGHSNGLSFPLSPVVKTRITLKMTLACLTGFGSSAFSAPLDVSASKEEQIKVHHAERPEIQNFPHAGFLEQPRRLTTRQNLAPIGRQPHWGGFNRGNGEGAGFGPVGRYGVAPWAEDWSYLRDQSHRNDLFDPLKFIALNNQRTIWLSLSERTRLRNWYNDYPMLGTNPHSGSGRFVTRNMFGADLHLGEHWRIFGQLVNGTAAGWNGYGYGSTYRKRLDLHQAFIEYKQTIGTAKTGLMFGRQQFLDAPSYVLYDREPPNIQITWNGPRAYAILPHIRFDLYDFVATNITPRAMFHDTQDWNTRLYGFNTTVDVPAFHLGQQRIQSYLDLFWIGFHLGGKTGSVPVLSSTTVKSVTGATSRNNLGVRWYGTAQQLEYALGILWQQGNFTPYGTTARRQVSAYSVNTTVGYRRSDLLFKPFFGVQTDVYSGGNERHREGTVATYSAPFAPQNPYLDYTGYIGAANLINLSPILVGSYGKVSLRVKTPILWRQTTQASVYSITSAYNFPKFHSHFVGVAPNGLLTWAVNRHWNWTHVVAWFAASHDLKNAGAKSGLYYQSSLSFAF